MEIEVPVYLIVLFIAFLLMQIATLVFVILLFIKQGKGSYSISSQPINTQNMNTVQQGQSTSQQFSGPPSQMLSNISGSPQGTPGGVVFCRKCGNQYDSVNSKCPSCGFSRK